MALVGEGGAVPNDGGHLQEGLPDHAYLQQAEMGLEVHLEALAERLDFKIAEAMEVVELMSNSFQQRFGEVEARLGLAEARLAGTCGESGREQPPSEVSAALGQLGSQQEALSATVQAHIQYHSQVEERFSQGFCAVSNDIQAIYKELAEYRQAPASPNHSDFVTYQNHLQRDNALRDEKLAAVEVALDRIREEVGELQAHASHEGVSQAKKDIIEFQNTLSRDNALRDAKCAALESAIHGIQADLAEMKALPPPGPAFQEHTGPRDERADQTRILESALFEPEQIKAHLASLENKVAGLEDKVACVDTQQRRMPEGLEGAGAAPLQHSTATDAEGGPERSHAHVASHPTEAAQTTERHSLAQRPATMDSPGEALGSERREVLHFDFQRHCEPCQGEECPQQQAGPAPSLFVRLGAGLSADGVQEDLQQLRFEHEKHATIISTLRDNVGQLEVALDAEVTRRCLLISELHTRIAREVAEISRQAELQREDIEEASSEARACRAELTTLRALQVRGEFDVARCERLREMLDRERSERLTDAAAARGKIACALQAEREQRALEAMECEEQREEGGLVLQLPCSRPRSR